MKAIYLTSIEGNYRRVFSKKIKEEIASIFEVKDKCFTKEDVLASKCVEVEAIFSTWGMETFSTEEIELYLPNLKYIFFAAGSVKYFAEPFLKRGVRIFSAWQANAIPVVEFSISEILLATKGFYSNVRATRLDYKQAQEYNANYLGNYDTNIGVLGFGAIGKRVVEELNRHKLNVFVYANNITKEDESKYHIKSASLEEIFSNCHVISNHLPNIECLQGIINSKLLDLLKPYSTLINTGRGAQIVEEDLFAKCEKDSTFTAVLDVTNPEPPLPESKINKLNNIYLTSHIAGSSGNEVVRMAEYMLDEAKRLNNNETPIYEITLSMLERMA